MNLLTLFLMCARAALATPVAIEACRRIDWEYPDFAAIVCGVLLANLAGAFWATTFVFVLSPAPADEAARWLVDTLLSLAVLAGFVYYRKRWLA